MEITKCIIPVAGKGTRFLPATKAISKEMLPIIDKPIILMQVIEAYKSGIKEIIFIVGKHNELLLKKLFSIDNELIEFLGDDLSKLALLDEIHEIINNVTFHYVYQDESIRGTSGALYAAKEYINKDEYFGVIYGDDVIDASIPALKQLIEENKLNNCNALAITQVPYEETYKYGIVKYKKDNIIDTFIEKPKIEEAPSRHASIGRYIIHGTIFDYLLKTPKHKNNEYYLVDAINILPEDTRTVNIDGTYYDVGSKIGFIKANINYGLKREEIKEGLQEYIDTLRK